MSIKKSLFLILVFLSCNIQAAPSQPRTVSMMIFVGSTDSHIPAGQFMNRYDAFATHIGKGLGAGVRLQIARDIDLMHRSLTTSHDLAYLNVESATRAMKLGWVPVVVRDDQITTAIVVAADSPAKAIADLRGKTIGAVKGTLLASFGFTHLNQAGISYEVKFANHSGQDYLFELLSSFRMVDAIIVRDEFANKRIAQQKAKGLKPDLRVLATTAPAPGFVLMARSSSLSDATMATLRKAMMALNPKEPADQPVFAGLDAGKVAAHGFRAPRDSDFVEAARVVAAMDSAQTKIR